jgi:hypothetical protein
MACGIDVDINWRERISSYLDQKNTFETYGLTRRKVFERAKLVKQCLDTGTIIFDMERHQAALGAESRPGSGMHSFITTLRQYTFRTAGGGAIEESAPTRGSKLKLDTWTAVEEYARYLAFEFTHLGGRRYQLHESCNCGNWEVSGKREALALATAVADGVSWDSDIDLLSYGLDTPLTPEQEEELAEKLHSNLVEVVRGKLESTWDDFMNERRALRRPRKVTS